MTFFSVELCWVQLDCLGSGPVVGQKIESDVEERPARSHHRYPPLYQQDCQDQRHSDPHLPFDLPVQLYIQTVARGKTRSPHVNRSEGARMKLHTNTNKLNEKQASLVPTRRKHQ